MRFIGFSLVGALMFVFATGVLATQNTPPKTSRVPAAAPALAPERPAPAHPKVGVSTSCLREHRYWSCENDAGIWICDTVGCKWAGPLPKDHPLNN